MPFGENRARPTHRIGAGGFGHLLVLTGASVGRERAAVRFGGPSLFYLGRVPTVGCAKHVLRQPYVASNRTEKKGQSP